MFAWRRPGRRVPLESVVAVRMPPSRADARTADALGTEREGSGSRHRSRRSGAHHRLPDSRGNCNAEITLQDERVVPAEVVAYDYETGFGLLQPLDRHRAAVDQAGRIGRPAAGQPGPGGELHHPRHRDAGGDAGLRGLAPRVRRLLGISAARRHLHRTAAPQLRRRRADWPGRAACWASARSSSPMRPTVGTQLAGNMFVPIDALKPILADMRAHGHSQGPAPPVARGVHRGAARPPLRAPGRARRAGRGSGRPARRRRHPRRRTAGRSRAWPISTSRSGPSVAPASRYPVTVLSGGQVRDLAITSGDRYDYLKLDPSF